jgi:hypothetical protein
MDNNGQSFSVIADKPGPAFNGSVTNLVFSANGKHFAYIAHSRVVENDIPRPLTMQAMINHKPVGEHKNMLWGFDGTLALNDNGDKLAYLVYPDDDEQNGTAVAINGDVGPFFNGIYGGHIFGTLHFDENDNVSFAAVKGDKVYWVTQAI